jgi:hypothetical protein
MKQQYLDLYSLVEIIMALVKMDVYDGIKESNSFKR